MRRFTNIDNEFCLREDLNLSQSYVYEWILNLNKWASFIILENNVYYFASKTKAVEDLPIVTKKINTMHVHYKALENKNLIIIKKIDGKDYIHITSKSKFWNLSNQFEKNQITFEKNQSKPLKKIRHIVNTNNIVNTNIVNKESSVFLEDKKINFEEIKEVFNLIVNNTTIPKIKKITLSRKKSIKKILKDYSLEDIGLVFNYAIESDFLCGNNKRGFSASFDWLTNFNNFTKTIEGNYKNKKTKVSLVKSASELFIQSTKK